MNDFWRGLAWQAFCILDKNGSGEIDKAEISSTYNALMHPDVRAGKRSEDEVLTEFLDTFEMHSSLLHPGEYNHKVSFDEFCEYYNNVSANIDNYEYFQLMMVNACKLGQHNGTQ